MKILYVGMKYDYGIPERGFSFEHYNFYETLVHMGHTIEYFDFMSEYHRYGSHKMTTMLLDLVKESKPDILFTFLFTDQFDLEIFSKIKNETSTITFNWFADDHWRFDTFTKYWAHCFSFVSTTDINSLKKYRSIGYNNVMLTQWGFNHFLYTKKLLPLIHDVSFIGQAHGNRNTIIRRLQKEGINIVVKGTHWNLRRWHAYAKKLHLLTDSKLQSIINETRITQDSMIEMFQQSKINLNMTASSQINFQNQIKGRNFEIPGCGGFQLSEYADRLEEYFTPNKEIVCYASTDEMIEKIKYYLMHDDVRMKIAEAGYQRAIQEHTYQKRFTDLFFQMGLS